MRSEPTSPMLSFYLEREFAIRADVSIIVEDDLRLTEQNPVVVVVHELILSDAVDIFAIVRVIITITTNNLLCALHHILLLAIVHVIHRLASVHPNAL